MAGGYRRACGECGFRTSWNTESAAEAEMEAHYATAHPGLIPGGMVQFDDKRQSDSIPPIVWVVIAVIIMCVCVIAGFQEDGY